MRRSMANGSALLFKGCTNPPIDRAGITGPIQNRHIIKEIPPFGGAQALPFRMVN
jgi:hypothetical protein